MFKKLNLVLATSLMVCYTFANPVSASQYTYSYDQNNRLSQILKDGAVYEDFSYDANGNLLQVSKTAPLAVSDSSTTANSIVLTWNSVPNVQKYSINQNGVKIGESTTPTFTVSGLTSTTTTAYTFTVTPTYNSGTTGQPGTLTVLVAPSNVHTTSVADTSVSLSWNAVTGATGYKVYGGESSTPITTSTPSATVANLVPGKAYTFTVVAYNAQAQGFASTVNATTTSSNPFTVTDSSTTSSSVNLTWNADPNAVSYSISKNGTKIADTTATTYEVSGLTSTTTTSYTFSVTPTYASGSTGPTGTLNMLLAPSNLHTDVVNSSYMSFSWDAVPGATSYTVWGNGQSITTSSTNSSISGLADQQNYTIIVYANNAQGMGFTSTATFRTSANTGGGGGGGGFNGGGPCGDIACASDVGPTHDALHTQPAEQAGTDNVLNHAQASAIAPSHPSLPTSNRPKTIIPETIIPETIIPEHIKASGKSVRAFTVLWIHHFLIETN